MGDGGIFQTQGYRDGGTLQTLGNGDAEIGRGGWGG